MNIFYDEKASAGNNTVTEKELQLFGGCLNEFLNVYTKHIYIQDNQTMDILNKLRLITNLISTRQYNQLFENPAATIVNDDIDDSMDDVSFMNYINDDDVPF